MVNIVYIPVEMDALILILFDTYFNTYEGLVYCRLELSNFDKHCNLYIEKHCCIHS